jgi:hypothetical protein
MYHQILSTTILESMYYLVNLSLRMAKLSCWSYLSMTRTLSSLQKIIKHEWFLAKNIVVFPCILLNLFKWHLDMSEWVLMVELQLLRLLQLTTISILRVFASCCLCYVFGLCWQFRKVVLRWLGDKTLLSVLVVLFNCDQSMLLFHQGSVPCLQGYG